MFGHTPFKLMDEDACHYQIQLKLHLDKISQFLVLVNVILRPPYITLIIKTRNSHGVYLFVMRQRQHDQFCMINGAWSYIAVRKDAYLALVVVLCSFCSANVFF